MLPHHSTAALQPSPLLADALYTHSIVCQLASANRHVPFWFQPGWCPFNSFRTSGEIRPTYSSILTVFNAKGPNRSHVIMAAPAAAPGRPRVASAGGLPVR